MKAKTAIDLFCGCGGLSEGLRQAGFGVIGALDNDPIASAAYRLNHPETLLFETNIQHLCPQELMISLKKMPGEIDLVAGCPPCQGFSKLNSKNGKYDRSGDPRNDLVFEFVRYVLELLPKAVMLENVPGLRRDNRFEVATKALTNAGYRVNTRILDAADFSVPQRRLRLVLMGRMDREPDFAPIQETRRTVRMAIGGLPVPGGTGDNAHDMTEVRSERIMALIKAIPKDGGSRTSLGKEHRLKCHEGFPGFKDVYGRLAWDGQAPTITTGCFNPSKGRFLHPEQDRAITLREAALLQSFPAHYQFPDAGKEAIGRLIGNALPPEMIRQNALAAFGDLHLSALGDLSKQ